ncbi:purine-nucleoside phosphorylase [Anaerobranca californiensis]|jgi:purine-nucleoside phosphorylase|nr:purine-nucleoside phosphorylase [Anaerobranca californiensis]
MEKLNQTVSYLKERVSFQPEIGMILGSGLGVLAEEIEDAVKIPYEEIPNFPVSTVSGHAGNLVFGYLQGKSVVAMQGRFHYYEGYSQIEVTFPVRVMKLLGVEKLLVTNAAGGVNKGFNVGQLMLITDHINLTGSNPLIGPNLDELGVRFPDMSEAYNKDLGKIAKKVAQSLGINLAEGVYVGFSGPNYETPQEIEMVRTIGGDAVGMSTVPEVIVANHCGLKVLGISCITNMAAGILDQPLDHSEVIQVTKQVREDFIQLVKNIIKEI